MPKGPKGQKRPADVISNAVTVMKIATGEIEEMLTEDGRSQAAVELGRKGGVARAAALSRARRVEIAKRGAAAKWGQRKNR
jgi:hypothetical protein